MKQTIVIVSVLLAALDLYSQQATSNKVSKPMMSRALLHNTVRIEAKKADGNGSVGTGFFFALPGSDRGFYPLAVTCWHVVSDSVAGKLEFALASSNALARAQDHFAIVLPQFEKAWIRHPDTNVDLAVLPLLPLFKILQTQGKKLDYQPVGEKTIPDEAEIHTYGIFQEIKFIGYPIGIWDEKNNLPIVRRGMTATDPVIDYNGRPEFLVDAAVFPGSSGSPVFVADEGFHNENGNLTGRSRLKFLGIIYAFPKYTSEGKVEITPIPTAFDATAKTDIPPNLGLVIKARRLMDFKAADLTPKKWT